MFTVESARLQKIAVKAALGLIIVAAGFYAFADREGTGTPVQIQERKQITEFKLPDLNGQDWRISEHRGKVVLLNFWATWCPPCRAETPGLVNLANSYKSKGLEVVGVNMDEDENAPVQDFVREYKVSYAVLRPPENSSLFNAVTSLPTTLLIDKNGRVAKKYDGAISEAQFRRDVDTLLAE